MKKYLRFSLLAIQKHLVYRARVITWIVLDITQTAIFPFLWLSILNGKEKIENFDKASIVTYYILIMVVNIMANSHISHYIQEDIIRGKLNEKIVKPMSYIFHRHMLEMGYKVLAISLLFIVLFAVSFFISDYLYIAPLSNFLLFFFFIICAHAIFVGFEFITGFSSFFIQEITSIVWLQSIFEKIFGGSFAPLSLLPGFIQSIATWLPFQFLYFIPIQIYLGKIEGANILLFAGGALFWIAVTWGVVLTLWKIGIKRYDGASV